MIRFKSFLSHYFVPLSDAPRLCGLSLHQILEAQSEGRLAVLKDSGKIFVYLEELRRFRVSSREIIPAGALVRRRPSTAGRNQEMVTMRDLGATYQEIGDKFGLSVAGAFFAVNQRKKKRVKYETVT